MSLEWRIRGLEQALEVSLMASRVRPRGGCGLPTICPLVVKSPLVAWLEQVPAACSLYLEIFESVD